MSDNIVSMDQFRAKSAPVPVVTEPRRKGRKTRGLGVFMLPPGAPAAIGVVGGNLTAFLTKPEFFDQRLNINAIGHCVRVEAGVELPELIEDEQPTPPPSAA